MNKKIVLIQNNIKITGILNDTKTAAKIWDMLPLEKLEANIWGGEVYCAVPLNADYENPVEVVKKGDIAFWPPGRAVCFFFGPTPVSRNREIRPAGSVNIIGKVEKGNQLLPYIEDFSEISLFKAGRGPD